MKECIEREALLSAAEGYDWKEGLKTVLKRIPAADVREVVLCRECKWTKKDDMDDPAIYCSKWDRWEMPPDGFCWLGKKGEVTDG